MNNSNCVFVLSVSVYGYMCSIYCDYHPCFNPVSSLLSSINRHCNQFLQRQPFVVIHPKTRTARVLLWQLQYPSPVLQILYNTLILPFFNYCILVWGATINNRNLLHQLQKKALRLISSSNYIAHTEPICKKLFLLKLTDMFLVAVWKFYY